MELAGAEPDTSPLLSVVATTACDVTGTVLVVGADVWVDAGEGFAGVVVLGGGGAAPWLNSAARCCFRRNLFHDDCQSANRIPRFKMRDANIQRENQFLVGFTGSVIVLQRQEIRNEFLHNEIIPNQNS